LPEGVHEPARRFYARVADFAAQRVRQATARGGFAGKVNHRVVFTELVGELPGLKGIPWDSLGIPAENGPDLRGITPDNRNRIAIAQQARDEPPADKTGTTRDQNAFHQQLLPRVCRNEKQRSAPQSNLRVKLPRLFSGRRRKNHLLR
jgi:hypothetical protein